MPPSPLLTLTRNPMKNSLWTLCSILTLLAGSATAQEQPGDIVVAFSEGPENSVKYFSGSGVENLELVGAGSTWSASAQMPDGRVAINDTNFMRRVRLYYPDGTLDLSFDYTPLYFSSDLDVFSDGVIAICSRLEGLLLFQDNGTPLGTYFPAGMNSPNGLQIQDDDTVWIADIMNINNPADGRIWHLDRNGSVLSTFPTTFDATDVAMAPDGTLWVSDNAGRLVNFDTQGNIRHEFDAQIVTPEKDLWSLAVTGDGLVWAAGHYDITMRGYANDGSVVSSFNMHTDAKPSFMRVIPGITWATSSCFGDMTAGVCPCGNIVSAESGCQNSTSSGATVLPGGTSSVSGDFFNLVAFGLPANRPAIAFVGSSSQFSATGAPFGDGLRCVGGPLQRLGTRVTGGAGEVTWGPGMAAQYGAWAPGDTSYFQVWYSDPFGPCSTNSNVTNGVEVTFTP